MLFEIVGASQSSTRFLIGDSNGNANIYAGTNLAVGSYELIFKALGGTTYLTIGMDSVTSGDYIDFDNISCKEIAGNHGIAPNDSARPQKTSTGAADWINYDGVDDEVIFYFTSSLGTSCTIARANVGSSPTILTGQTIGTTYSDSTDNAGLVIIDRALTGPETTDLTAWLTAKGAT